MCGTLRRTRQDTVGIATTQHPHMPQLIEHIDAIARAKQRDVLFLQFTDPMDQEIELGRQPAGSDWATVASRLAVIDWLRQNQIGWSPCGEVADTNSMRSYAGQIVIDVPFNEASPFYQRVLGYLENPDGSSRIPGVWLCALKLDAAMNNAHHDEPGFWERWAEGL